MGVNFQIFFEVIRLEVELGIDADDHLAHVLEPLLDRRRKKLRGRAEDVIELDHELRDCHLTFRLSWVEPVSNSWATCSTYGIIIVV